MERRQCAEVLLDQRLDGRDVEAAREDEGEIARRPRSGSCRRRAISAGSSRSTISASSDALEVALCDSVVCSVCLNAHSGLACRSASIVFICVVDHPEDRRIGAWLGHAQVDQLEHRLQVLWRRVARSALRPSRR